MKYVMIVIKPNTTANTDQTSEVVLNPASGTLQLRSLSTSPVIVTTSDNNAPEIHNITTITNTTLNIEFTEDIETDTKFEINSFRVSGTDAHVSVTGVSKTSSNNHRRCRE